jgi:RHS repeat-associated protein
MQTDAITFSGTDFNWDNILKQSQYTFDGQGRMTGATSTDNTGTPTTTITTFTYDPSGIRTGQTISQTVGSTTTNTTITYLYDANNPTGYQQLLEQSTTTGSNTTKTTYTLGLDIIAQHDSTNGTLTLLYDGHGSTRAVMDANSTVVQRYAYDAYGNQLNASGLTAAASALSSLLYSGEHTDKGGMQYLRARNYDPSLGRFTSRDIYRPNAFNTLDQNPYVFVNGNPINLWDPAGKWTLAEVLVTVANGARLVGTFYRTIKPGVQALDYIMMAALTAKAVFRPSSFTKVDGFLLGSSLAFTILNKTGLLDVAAAGVGALFLKNAVQWGLKIPSAALESTTAFRTFLGGIEGLEVGQTGAIITKGGGEAAGTFSLVVKDAEEIPTITLSAGAPLSTMVHEYVHYLQYLSEGRQIGRTITAAEWPRMIANFRDAYETGAKFVGLLLGA